MWIHEVLLIVSLLPTASVALREDDPLIVLSLGGMRHDFFKLAPTGNLFRIAKQGVRSDYMETGYGRRKTSLQTLFTGPIPEEHSTSSIQYLTGDSREVFEDAVKPRLSYVESVLSGYAGRRVVVNYPDKELYQNITSFANQLRLAATYRDYFVKSEGALREALGNLTNKRKTLVAVFFDFLSVIGRRFGIKSLQYKLALQSMDTNMVGYILKFLKEKRIEANLVVIGDGGLEDIYVSVKSNRMVTASDVVAMATKSDSVFFWPKEGRREQVVNQLRSSGLVDVLSSSEFRNRDGNREQPIIALAKKSVGFFTRAEDSFNNARRSSRTVFLGAGPAFRRGVVSAPIKDDNADYVIAFLLGMDLKRKDDMDVSLREVTNPGYAPYPGYRYVETAVSRLSSPCENATKSRISGTVFIAEKEEATVFRVELRGLRKKTYYKLYVHEFGDTLNNGCYGVGRIVSKLRYTTSRGRTSFVLFVPDDGGNSSTQFELSSKLLSSRDSILGRSLVLYDILNRDRSSNRVACGRTAVSQEESVARRIN